MLALTCSLSHIVGIVLYCKFKLRKCASSQIDKSLSFLNSFVQQSFEKGAQPYIPENDRSGVLDVSSLKSQDHHEVSAHSLRFDAYELPKPVVPSRAPPVSLSPSTELVPVPEPSYPKEVRQTASVSSFSEAGPSELKLRLDGVQKKWGKPTYSSPAPSTSSSSSQKTVNGVTQSDSMGNPNSKTRNTSYDSRRSQVEISPEKQKLAASLFGGALKPEKRPSSTGHKVSKTSINSGAKAHMEKGMISASEISTEKTTPLQPPPDLLDLGEPSVTNMAPFVDPFKQLEGLLDPSQDASALDYGASKSPDFMSLYADMPTSGQTSTVANPLSNNLESFGSANGESTVVYPTQTNKGPNLRDALEKDALVRQMGVTPSTQNPNLFRDLLG